MVKTFFSFSLLALIWSVYYLAMHITGGILTNADVVICGSVMLVCIGGILFYLCKRKKKSM